MCILFIILVSNIKYVLLDTDLWTKIRNITSTTTQVVYTTYYVEVGSIGQPIATSQGERRLLAETGEPNAERVPHAA